MRKLKINKTRIIALIMALLIIILAIPTIFKTGVSAAPEVYKTHSSGNYTAQYYGDLIQPIQIQITSAGMMEIRKIYGANADFLPDQAGGLYKPMTYLLSVDGQPAICANPTVMVGTSYSDKIVLSSPEVNQKNSEAFFDQYMIYRYPDSAVRQRIIDYYSGSETTVRNNAFRSFIAGILYRSVSENNLETLIKLFQTEKPGQDLSGVVNTFQLKDPANAVFWSWYYSYDAEIMRATGGQVIPYSSKEVRQSFINFYDFIREKIDEGSVIIRDPNVSIYYNPEQPNQDALFSHNQVIHVFNGNLEIDTKGELKLIKVSTYPKLTENNNCYSLSGAEFGIYKSEAAAKNNLEKLGILITDQTGISNTIEDIETGTYYLKELKAPKGYSLDPKIHKVIVEAGELTQVEISDLPQSNPVLLLLSKQDENTGLSEAQTDASFAEAEFEVKYYGSEYQADFDPASEGIKPDATWLFKTDLNGEIKLSADYLVSENSDPLFYNSQGIAVFPLGTITIQEIKAPQGYLLNSEIFVQKVTAEGNFETVKTFHSPIVQEKPIIGKFSLRKVITDGTESEIVKPEPGAVFIAIAKKYIDQYGSFEAALEHSTDFGINEFSRLVTDQNGNAVSGDLAFGKYLIKQIAGQNETDLLQRAFEFEVKRDGDFAEYTVNNLPTMYPVKIIKRDSQTGESIILNSAGFKIIDSEGNYVRFKVGSQNYDVFKTTALNSGEIPSGTFYVETEEEGTLVTPLKLKAGTYFLEEVISPEGYQIISEPLEFKIGAAHVAETDQDLDEYIVVEAENEPQYGELILHKQGELFNKWEEETITLPVQTKGETVTREIAVPRSEEALILSKTYLDQIEQSTVYSDQNGLFEKEVGPGFYSLKDKNNQILIEYAVAEGSTDLISVQLPDKLILEEVWQPGEIIEQTFTYSKPVYESGYLENAEFELRAAEEIKSFDGQTIFYEKGEKLLFAQQDIILDQETIYLKGEVITFPKLLPEQLADETLVSNKVITEAEPLILSKIPLGKYKLIEIKAPTGYIKDNSEREFEFTAQASTMLVDLKETLPINNQRQKLNLELKKELFGTEYFIDYGFENIILGLYTGDELLGLNPDSAISIVTPDENGVITIEDIPAGNYYLKEISTKDGYVLSESMYNIVLVADESAVEDRIEIIQEPIINQPSVKDIKITKKDSDTGYPLVGVQFNLFAIKADGSKIMVNNPDSGDHIFVTDQNGEILLKGLPYGNYFLEEIKAATGYIKDGNSKNIAVSDESALEIKVENEATRVGFNKIDANTGKSVIGACLRLLDQFGNLVYLDQNGYLTNDRENGQPAEWTTDGTMYYVNGLIVGHQYTVEEVTAPVGYHQADPISFIVSDNQGIQLTNIPNLPLEPKIKTKAMFENGTKTAYPAEQLVVVDLVSYVDLIVGQKYKLKGKLVCKSDPGNIIAEAETSFIAKNSSGEIEVRFEFKGESLAGKELVVFEELYFENKMIAQHKDLNDSNQTVKIIESKRIEAPTELTKQPEKPETFDNSETPLLWLSLGLLSLGISLMIYILYKKKTKD